MFTKKEYILIGLAAIVIAVIVGFQVQTNKLITKLSTQRVVGGNLTETPGIQNSSDPVTTMSNVSVYDLDVNGRLYVTGTTTIPKSYDGFNIYKALTISTSSPQNIHTNSSGVTELCQGRSLAASFTATALAPTLYFSMGTSTSATGNSGSLIASSTLATSTTALLYSSADTVRPFLLANGESINALLGDIYTSASSTYFSRWSGYVSLGCTLLGQ